MGFGKAGLIWLYSIHEDCGLGRGRLNDRQLAALVGPSVVQTSGWFSSSPGLVTLKEKAHLKV